VSASILTLVPLGLAPVPELGFVLQCGAAGTAIGTAVAARARRRRSDADAAAITAAWSLLGLGVGTAVAVASALSRMIG